MMPDRLELHAVLTGNPGTGKTTLARLLARLYHELGLLERDEVVEVDRSHLVGPTSARPNNARWTPFAERPAASCSLTRLTA